jgi:hypothetical protein
VIVDEKMFAGRLVFQAEMVFALDVAIFAAIVVVRIETDYLLAYRTSTRKETTMVEPKHITLFDYSLFCCVSLLAGLSPDFMAITVF